jgi:Flp pilus assembly protein TadD
VSIVGFATYRTGISSWESATVARAMRSQGEPSQPAHQIERAMNMWPANRTLRELNFQRVAKTNDVPAMITAANAWVAVAPDISAARVALGNALGMSKDWNGAIREFERAVTLSPTNIAAMFNLAQCYVQVGDKARAREVLTQAERCARGGLPPDMTALNQSLYGAYP